MEHSLIGSDNNKALTSLFSVSDILVKQSGIGRNELVRKMVEHLTASHQLAEPESYIEAIIERENLNDTVLSYGVALPHARVADIPRPYVAIATSADGIIFSDDKPPVHMVLLVLSPQDRPELYLKIISSLSSVLRDPAVIKKLAKASSAEEVMKFFERSKLVLPGYVCAADIMDKNFESLHVHDSLKVAIDSFIARRHSIIPVLDSEGDMVGIVTAFALLKVCLPEYLMWMSDLSPIINFEPFVEVLRKEQSAWLSDILVEDFPAVQMSAPAISVAAELARRNSAVCYVLNDKKLVGIITLPQFLNKIFRE